MRVAESVEKMTIGVLGSYTYGPGTVYGYTNFPSRLTKVMTNPTAPGWVPQTTVTELLSMIGSLQAGFFFGNYVLYHSPNWLPFLYGDYSQTNVHYATLRESIERIDLIEKVQQLDWLTGYQMILIQMDSGVAEAVQGMDFTTVQWESHGGLQINFKLMCIMIPRLRTAANGNVGIIHGTAP
jgi:hypothetical protein